MKQLIVEGEIVESGDKYIYDWFDIPAVSPGEVRDFLSNSAGEEVELVINSPGGSVWAAVDMAEQLRAYSKNVTAYITGLAASAATILMCGADSVVASEAAQFMIHNAWTVAQGDYRDMESAAQMARTSSENIRAIYATKTGLPDEALQEMMDKETWMTAKEALGKGFVDSIREPAKQKVRMAASFGGSPDIDKLRAAYQAAHPAPGAEEKPAEDWLERATARLAIENIRYEFITTERGN